MQLPIEIIHELMPLSIRAEISIADVWLGSDQASSHGGLTKEIKLNFIQNHHVENIFCKADMGNLVSISLFVV